MHPTVLYDPIVSVGVVVRWRRQFVLISITVVKRVQEEDALSELPDSALTPMSSFKNEGRRNAAFRIQLWVSICTVSFAVLALWQSHASVREFSQPAFSLDTQQTPNVISIGQTRRLIIHIGPPKTGSTTLQKGLGDLSEALFSDGYLYLGKRRSANLTEWTIQKKLLAVSCHSQLESFRRIAQSNGKYDVPLNYTSVSCWQSVVQELEQIMMQFPDTNILLSEEGFSEAPMLSSYDERPAFMEALLQLVKRVGMELAIVASYRHYEEQMFSAHKMQCLSKQDQLRVECQQSLIEKLEHWMRNPNEIFLTRPLDKSLAAWERQLPKSSIRIFDLERREIHPTVQFVCSILDLDKGDAAAAGGMKNSCAKARETAFRTRQRSITNIRFQRLLVVRGILDILRDNMATFNETELEGTLNQFLQDTEKSNCRITDLPWRCPTQDRLDELLQVSLSLEKKYRLRTLVGTNTSFDDLAVLLQKTHKDLFGKSAMEEKRYCDFDASALRIDFGFLQNTTSSNEVWSRIRPSLEKFYSRGNES